MSSRAKKTPENSAAKRDAESLSTETGGKNRPAGAQCSAERVGFAISPTDGSPLYYRTAGPKDPQAVPIALSDGLGCDGFVWKYIFRDLAPLYRLVHWNYPGHGRSPKRRDPARMSIPDLADDLLAVLDDAGAERAVLFGHSLGVQVSLEVYRRHPERVLAMVFLCGMAENPLKTFRGTDALEKVIPAIRAAVQRAPRLSSRVIRTVLPTRLAYTVATFLEVNPDLLDATDFMPYLRGMSRVEPGLFLDVLTQAGNHSAVDLLPDVAVPTLVVGGDRDGFTPPELSTELAERIPNAELLLVDGGSHSAPIERPDFVNEVILDFLARRVRTENE